FRGLADSTEQQAELIVRLHGSRIERNRPLENLFGFVIFVLLQEYAPQFDVRRRMLRMTPEEVAKNCDGAFVLTKGIIGEPQVIRCRNLLALSLQAFLERGFGLGIITLQVVYRTHRVLQDSIVRMLSQESTK